MRWRGDFAKHISARFRGILSEREYLGFPMLGRETVDAPASQRCSDGYFFADKTAGCVIPMVN